MSLYPTLVGRTGSQPDSTLSLCVGGLAGDRLCEVSLLMVLDTPILYPCAGEK